MKSLNYEVIQTSAVRSVSSRFSDDGIESEIIYTGYKIVVTHKDEKHTIATSKVRKTRHIDSIGDYKITTDGFNPDNIANVQLIRAYKSGITCCIGFKDGSNQLTGLHQATINARTKGKM